MKTGKQTRFSFIAQVPRNHVAMNVVAGGRARIGRQVFDVEPLFASDVLSPSKENSSGENGDRLKGAPQAEWFLLKARSAAGAGQHPWDLAHRLCRKFSAPGDPVYVEPDIEQSWPYLNREQPAPGDAFELATGYAVELATGESRPRGARCARARTESRDNLCTQNGPDTAWPSKSKFAWHLDDDASQLRSAREHAMNNGMPGRVRICHLDTGFDPNHVTTPSNINLTLARNFVENSNDASDPGKRGLLYNPGHGTGTIGILAGDYIELVEGDQRIFAGHLGGAPLCEIVPVRVANSVVHLFTSSMARGIAYAARPGEAGDNERACDVVSISMGGLPSRAWSAAVNRAYDAGVVIVAAGGNNFGGFPIRNLVWPARFKRVIAACGVTADLSPYYKTGLHFKMQGCFGPAEDMTHALSAFTPNIPWAELGCTDVIDLDGAGTSSATPQVAAAAALYVSTHLDQLESNWRRVEAVRRALFLSAYKGLPDSEKYFGNGVLKAFDALNVGVSELGDDGASDCAVPGVSNFAAEPLPEDDIFFPIFHRLTAWNDVDQVTCKMYEVEAAQLYAGHAQLQQMYPDIERGVLLGATIKEVLGSFIDLPDISHALRRFLMDALALEAVGNAISSC